MPSHEIEVLLAALRGEYAYSGGEKVNRYIGQFYNCKRIGTKIVALVEGNHGTYTVSIQVEWPKKVTSACSCYIGKSGDCHHCAALAKTFLRDPSLFTEIIPKKLEEVQELSELPQYLEYVTLDELLDKLRSTGITQKALGESIGMSSQHLSAMKSSERRNRRHKELGATKLACLWVLEHFPHR